MAEAYIQGIEERLSVGEPVDRIASVASFFLSRINVLVDLANLVSIRYALPVAVFDQRGVAGGTTVRLAHGGEPWSDLGSSETEHPEPGEVIFADDDEQVSARRWCWLSAASRWRNRVRS